MERCAQPNDASHADSEVLRGGAVPAYRDTPLTANRPSGAYGLFAVQSREFVVVQE